MNLKITIAALAAVTMLTGCAAWDSLSFGPKHEVHPVAFHENSVNSLALGRYYQAQGRFELARETFLHGLATARNDDMKERLAEELEATDRLILSNR